MKHEPVSCAKRPALPANMYQSNKSLLVIQEATKNDRSSVPKKLVEYIVRLQETNGKKEKSHFPVELEAPPTSEENPTSQKWCTAREHSAWILTQLQAIFLTKQHWRMRKVIFIIHILLWRGSRVFIEEFHTQVARKELCFFDFPRIMACLQTPQTNPTGAELPSVLSKDDHKSTSNKKESTGQTHTATPVNRLYEAMDLVMSKLFEPSNLFDGECSFYISWKKNAMKNGGVTDVEAFRSTLVEEHMSNHMAYLESLLNYRYEFPRVDLMNIFVHGANLHGTDDQESMRLTELEALMAATLELMKSTVFKRVNVPFCAVNSMNMLFRYYNAHVLYKIASQVMTGILNYIIRQFLPLLKQLDVSGIQPMADNDGALLPSPRPNDAGMQRQPQMTREKYQLLPPQQKLTILAREWYTMLYQFNRIGTFYVARSAELQKFVQLPITESKWINVLPTDTFVAMKTYGFLHPSSDVCSWCLNEEDTPLCHPQNGHHVPPCALHLIKAWKQQVKNIRALFRKSVPRVLYTLESELAQVESEYTNRTTAIYSAPHTVPRPASTFITEALTNTFVIRRNGADSRKTSPLTGRDTDADVHYLDQLMGQASESIETLLQQDDVVVVCPDDFSATDKLKLADRFVVIKEQPLGEGGYGKVYRAWDELEGTYLAAKEVPLDDHKGTLVDAVHDALHEYTILTQLQHPHVVSVKAFMVTGRVGTIFMEWMPCGSLQEVLKSSPRRCLRESIVARYMRDALRGLEYLHSRDIMHRDVKPANMLLGTDGSVKLTDFGNSFEMAEGARTVENSLVTGTAPYMAPEYARGTCSCAGDIWSLGCSAVELLSGLVPWSDPVTGARMEMLPLVFRIGNLDDDKHKERPHTLVWSRMVENAGGDGLSAELRSFLDEIFIVDRHARPTATQLLQHPFILKRGKCVRDD